MATLTPIAWQSVANEANVRALLEDFVSQYTSPSNQLALAVWFDKGPQGNEHKLLMMVEGPEMNQIDPVRYPLLWKAGVEGGPSIVIHWISVASFRRQFRSNDNRVQEFFRNFEVLYFQTQRLSPPPDILTAFRIVTGPSGLIKGWCVYHDQYEKGQTVRTLLASRVRLRQDVGIVKTWESPDFQTCKAIFHVEAGQYWRPASPEGFMQTTGFYSDWEAGRPVYFLAEGGAFYQIDRFEVIYAPDYSGLVIERRPDDRYLEVYLRAVHPPEQPAA